MRARPWRLGVLLVCACLAGIRSDLRAQAVTSSQPLTITTTARGLTDVASLTFCRGVVEGGNIRMALDGGTATATVGRPVLAGERILLNNPLDVQHFSAIATTTTTTTIGMYCGTGTAPAISAVESPPTNPALPLCTALTRPAGNCR